MSRENTAAAEAAKREKVELDPRFIARLTATLLGICAVVALLLGLVNYVTEPIIEEMKAEKTRAAMAQVLQAEDYQIVETDAANVSALYRAVAGGEQVGYVVEVTSNGFGGAISMVVGVDMSGTVTGVAVTDHRENRDTGAKALTPAALSRYVGKAGTIRASGSNSVDAVSGATATSHAITAGVNRALAIVANLDTEGADIYYEDSEAG